MNRWAQVDIAKGLAMTLIAFGLANLWLTANPHYEGLMGVYSDAPWPRFGARLLTSTTPPTFFALSGLVIGKRLADLPDDAARARFAQHLFSRGLWLVFLELGITQLYNVSHPGTDYVLVFEVLSAFGWSFVVIAVAHRVPRGAWMPAAIALWVVPELLGPFSVRDDIGGFALAALTTVADRPPWLVEYPVTSWLPFVLVGASLGRRWAKGGLPSARWFATVAVGSAVAFLFLRSTTSLGTLGQAPASSAQEFLSPTRYPVSLQYVLWGTAGGAATLALASVLVGRGIARPLMTLGRQPLAAFVLIKVLVALAQVTFDVRAHAGGLLGAVGVAVILVAILVPVLAAYDRLKRREARDHVALRLL